MRQISINTDHLIIFLFWFLVIYGSTDGSGYLNNPTPLWSFLSTGIIISNGFIGVEIGIIIFSIYFLVKYKKHYRLYKDGRLAYFLVLMLVLSLIAINPKNSADIFKTFLGMDSKFILLLPLLYVTLIFLDPEIYARLLISILKIGFLVIFFKAVSNLIFYFLGTAQTLQNGAFSTLPQADVLYFTGVAVSFLIYLFLVKGRTKNLLIAGLLFLIMLLSFRRTELFSTFSVISIVLMYFIWLYRSKVAFSRFSKILLVPLLLSGIFALTTTNFSTIISRYVTVLAYFDESLEDEEFKDTGHLKQAVTVTNNMMENLVFWGAGLQNDAYYLEGQSTRIHSNLAFGMVKQGIFVPLFFIYSFLLFIFLGFKALLLPKKKYGKDFKLYRVMVISMLVLYFITGWASGNTPFDQYTQSYVSLVLIYSLLKLNPQQLETLIQRCHGNLP